MLYDQTILLHQASLLDLHILSKNNLFLKSVLKAFQSEIPNIKNRDGLIEDGFHLGTKMEDNFF